MNNDHRNTEFYVLRPRNQRNTSNLFQKLHGQNEVILKLRFLSEIQSGILKTPLSSLHVCTVHQ